MTTSEIVPAGTTTLDPIQTSTLSGQLPILTADPNEVLRISQNIDLEDRAALAVYGDRAQKDATVFSEKILSNVRSSDMGDAGELLAAVLMKAKSLDPASIQKQSFFSRLFGLVKARIERFRMEFQTVANQIEQIGFQLEVHRDGLRRDIAIFDNMHEETLAAILKLDAYIQAGKKFAEEFRANELPKLQAHAEQAKSSAGGGLLEAQYFQDQVQSLERLEKRVFYLQQARQMAIQQLPQIRIVQASDETLIESLQATLALTIPQWKQKMVLLLGLSRQQSALELQNTVTEATSEMVRQTSSMMKDQAIAIEEQSQKGIVDMDALVQANRDLIDTVETVLQIQRQGRKDRAAAEVQMAQMTSELKKVLSQQV